MSVGLFACVWAYIYYTTHNAVFRRTSPFRIWPICEFYFIYPYIKQFQELAIVLYRADFRDVYGLFKCLLLGVNEDGLYVVP